MATSKPNLVPNFLIGFGLLLLLAGWYGDFSLMRNGTRAQGVVEKITCCSRSTEGVEVRIDKGVSKPPLRLGTSAHQGKYQVGNVVTVVYDPERPDGALIFQGEPSWFGVIMLFAIGVAVTILGLVGRWIIRLPDRQPG
jgi:hypothetical protein